MNAWWTINDWMDNLNKERFSAEEGIRWVLSRIEEVDGDLNSLCRLDAKGALKQAKEIDRRRRSHDPLGPLAGLPVVLKDNIITKGLETSCASAILKGFVPPYDATVTKRLKEAGAIVVGKANLDEFGMGSATLHSVHGPTRNPWDTNKVAGGSSGGCAAAVAAGLVPAALGSDTGGSIRQPAALTGCVGLKPTYGLVSRYGLVSYASSLDQIGPLTRSVEDAATLLSIIAGHDALDSTSSPRPNQDYRHLSLGGLQGLRIGLPEEFFPQPGLDTIVNTWVRAAINHLATLGTHIIPISMPNTRHAVASYYLIATAEASSNLARYDGIRYGHRSAEPCDLEELYRRTRTEGFGPEAKRRILLGTFALSAGYQEEFYLKATKVRHLVANDFKKAFEKVDVIVGPTSPVLPFDVDSQLPKDPLQMYLLDTLTIPANLAGLPAISIPCGFSREELPVGLQIMAPPFREDLALRTAKAFDDTTDFHQRRPPQPWAGILEELEE